MSHLHGARRCHLQPEDLHYGPYNSFTDYVVKCLFYLHAKQVRLTETAVTTAIKNPYILPPPACGAADQREQWLPHT